MPSLADLGRVPERAVGHEAGGLPRLQPGEEDPAGRGRLGLVAAVHDEHVAGRDLLDRRALRVVVVLEDLERVDVLPRGDVPQREGGTGHPMVRERLDALQEDVAQPAREQLRRDRGGADLLQELQGAIHGHGRIAGVKELRSHRWYGVNDLRSFGHRSRTFQMGYDREDFAGKPVIAVVNTWSDINPCHTHLRDRAQDVKRGVWQAGGFPLEIPALSLSEPFQKPSTMLYRNLLAMETEELLRSYPFDGAVLAGRVRQDDARAGHGGGVVPACRSSSCRAGPMLRASLAGIDPRVRVRRLEVLGRAARRRDHPGRVGGGRGADRVARPGTA